MFLISMIFFVHNFFNRNTQVQNTPNDDSNQIKIVNNSTKNSDANKLDFYKVFIGSFIMIELKKQTI